VIRNCVSLNGITCSSCKRKMPPFPVKRNCKHPADVFHKVSVGTILKEKLGRFGFLADGGCKCTARASQMDAWGAKGCRQNFEIIHGWLRDEAKARRIPFASALAKWLLSSVLKEAEEKERLLNIQL